MYDAQIEQAFVLSNLLEYSGDGSVVLLQVGITAQTFRP